MCKWREKENLWEAVKTSRAVPEVAEIILWKLFPLPSCSPNLSISVPRKMYIWKADWHNYSTEKLVRNGKIALKKKPLGITSKGKKKEKKKEKIVLFVQSLCATNAERRTLLSKFRTLLLACALH